MFVLFTDFGYRGPYVGQLHASLAQADPVVPIIDLCHQAPPMDPRGAAYLLEPFTRGLPVGAVVIAVVDPGVGTERAAWMVEADGRFFIGPDNGLMEMVVRRAETVRAWRLPTAPPEASSTFHGRDVFAPVAAAVMRGDFGGLDEIEPSERVRLDWADDTPRVLLIDDYGNAMTGIREELLSDGAIIQVGDYKLRRADTFGAMPQGSAFWFRNSSGLAELAVNGGSAASVLKLVLGSSVRLLVP
ncbi:MAG: SAM-dependent chlorinase/fluorinase [Ectothiorhodospiraceae bacterium]|nr:SAM-dependent chlorinase/fluorinase [Ectothiorhodospiraceae bacterium]MCH8503550.1 SAM-dependent chlorinase/fluorinase [Ectothiorhodospiraceae bacterium]